MAQLRAKQIKLSQAGDLLVGGTGGNGTVLSLGNANQILKIVSGNLTYVDNTASDIAFSAGGGIVSTTVQAAISEVASTAASNLTSAIATEVTNRDSAISTAVTAATTTLQGEITTIETNVGLNGSGAFAPISGSTHTGVSSATSLIGAVTAIDTALTTEEAARAAAVTTLEGELTTTQAGAGLNNGGTYTAPTGTNYLGSATSLKGADVLLDTAVKAEVTRATGVETGLQTELDTTQAGAGLGTDGTYTAPTGTNYLGSTTSLANADITLDTAIKAEVDRATAAEGVLTSAISSEASTRASADTALQTELDATQAGAGLGVSGTYSHETASNYINGATSLKNADFLLDAAIFTLSGEVASLGGTTVTALQTEVDAIESAIGLDASGNLVAFQTGGYVAGKTTYLAAVNALDTQAVTAAGEITTLQGQVSALSGLGALHFQGDLAGTATAGDLATAGAGGSAPATGDVFRIITAGATDFAGTGIEVNVGDFVVKTATGYVKFDNTDPTVTAGDSTITVTGDAHAGYAIKVNTANIVSGDSAITVTGGVGAALVGTTIDLVPGNINFETLGHVGTPVTGNYLQWNGTSLAYKSAGDLGITVRAEEDFDGTNTANFSFNTAHTPSGPVAVFINGVKVANAGFTLSGTDVTLVDSVIGYSVEVGDTVSVSYSYLAA